MKHLKQLLLLLCCCIAVQGYGRHTSATDSTNCSDRCCCPGSSQTPVGIMTDHVHSKGQWMASYMYMNMLMNGNQAGTNKATDDITYIKYMMAPEKMSMQMHMAMLMYGLTDRVTLMAMGGYTINSMSMGMIPGTHAHTHTMGGGNMTTSGFTDTRVSVLYSLLNKPAHRVIVTGGVSIPSGSARKTSDMYGTPQVASYCMQPGTGTFALLPAVTYVHMRGKLSLGTQAAADIKLGKNPQNYKFGDVYSLNIWAGYQVFSFMSVSLRAEGMTTGSIKGFDPDIALYMNNDPTADVANSGGKKITGYGGLNFSFNKLPVLHMLVEYGVPAYQYVNGLQMSSQANLLGSIQYTF